MNRFEAEDPKTKKRLDALREAALAPETRSKGSRGSRSNEQKPTSYTFTYDTPINRHKLTLQFVVVLAGVVATILYFILASTHPPLEKVFFAIVVISIEAQSFLQFIRLYRRMNGERVTLGDTSVEFFKGGKSRRYEMRDVKQLFYRNVDGNTQREYHVVFKNGEEVSFDTTLENCEKVSSYVSIKTLKSFTPVSLKDVKKSKTD